jgi:hypothetical protein
MNRQASDMPADDPEHRRTLRQADQARSDFAAILDELEFVKGQLALMPTRAYVSRMALMTTVSLSARPSRCCSCGEGRHGL